MTAKRGRRSRFDEAVTGRAYGVGMERPDWANAHPELRAYYDNEWGFAVRDTPGIYERIVLESFQSGLSWLTILRRRDALRRVFAGFDPESVASFTDADVERLMSDESIIRNRRKIASAITNARATISMSADGEDLGEFVWSFRPTDPRAVSTKSPSRSPESAALASALRERGFTMVGPVTMYALMQAVGILEHRL